MREAVHRANAALRAEPFEERTLTQIRTLPPREWSDSVTSPSEAGPDAEVRLLQSIQQFLATAGHRPLTVSLDPGERVVVQIVFHVHSDGA